MAHPGHRTRLPGRSPLIESARKRERRESAGRRSGLHQATLLFTGARVVVAMRYSANDTKVPMPVARATKDDVTRFVQDGRHLGLPVLHAPRIAEALFETVQIGQAILGQAVSRDMFQAVILCVRKPELI